MPKTCTAHVDLIDDDTHKCILPEGHEGPVHRSSAGEEWGDSALSPGLLLNLPRPAGPPADEDN